MRQCFGRFLLCEERPAFIPSIIHLRVVQQAAEFLERLSMVIYTNIDRSVGEAPVATVLLSDN
jgi:hypothetical protein